MAPAPSRRRPLSLDADSLCVAIVGPVGFVYGAIRDSLAAGDIVAVGEPAAFVDVGMLLTVRPDVVIVDLDACGSDWADGIRDLLRVAPDMHVVVLAARQLESDVVTAVSVGARGFLTKDLSAEALRRAIGGIRRGELAMSRTTAAVALAGMNGRVRGKRSSELRGPLASLTPRELEVIRLVAEGLRDREIAERLSLSVRTVEAHVAQVRRRLGVRTRAQAVVRYLGLVDETS